MAYINFALTRELAESELAKIENKTGLHLTLDVDTLYFAEDEEDEDEKDEFMEFSDNAGVALGILDEMGILESYAGDYSMVNWKAKTKQGREFAKNISK